jgi:LuxR family maltose regulon positive regulatory protein
MLSKLQPPPARSEMVARPSLVEKLRTGLRSGEAFVRRLTLLSAPAGSGKTSLAAEWLRTGDYGYAWLSLDENDNDPVRFITYLVGALQGVNGELGKATQEMLKSPQMPPLNDMLASLVGEITALDAPLTLALDDYHFIQSLPVHQAIQFLLEYQPANLHLVIITREDPPVPISRLRARGQLLEIRQNDLRFSLDECARFLGEVMRLDLSDDDIAALARRTEGWVVGLQLAALAMQGAPDRSAFVQSFTGSHRYILDYLLDEVLEGQPPDLQEFFLKTSILERLSAPLCDALTGYNDSRERLQALDAANLFINPLDQNREWYRYHRLFAELLRHRLRLQPGISLDELHHTASVWFEDNGFLVDAIQHALSAEDWPRASGLILQQYDAMLRDGEYVTLIDWCQRIPERVIKADPKLCLAYAWPLLLKGEYETAAALLVQAESLAFENQTLLGEIAAAQAYLAQVNGDGARLVQFSERALALLPADNLSGRCLVALNLGLAYWHVGRIDAADKAFEEALQAAHRTSNHYALATAEIFLARSLAVRGLLRQAEARLLEIEARGMRTPIMTLLYLDLATLYYEWNDLARAREYLHKGTQIAQKIGNQEFEIAAHLLWARLYHAQGQPGQATHAIQQADRIVAGGGVPARTGDRILALQTELSWGESVFAQEPPEGVDAHPFYRYLGLARIRYLLAQGRQAEALDLLEKTAATAEAAGWGYGQVALYTLWALATDEQLAAIARLQQAIELAQPQGYLRIFVDAGPRLAPLLQEAARQGVYPQYVGQILAAMRVETLPGHAPSYPARGDAARSMADQIVEPLSEREIEVLRLLAAGLSNRQIAEQLVIGLNTVKSHVHNICGKLGASNRTQAVALARGLGMLE